MFQNLFLGHIIGTDKNEDGDSILHDILYDSYKEGVAITSNFMNSCSFSQRVNSRYPDVL